jgi:hypothetical protein
MWLWVTARSRFYGEDQKRCSGGCRWCRTQSWRARTRLGRLRRMAWIVTRPIAVRPIIRVKVELQRKWSAQCSVRGLKIDVRRRVRESRT